MNVSKIIGWIATFLMAGAGVAAPLISNLGVSNEAIDPEPVKPIEEVLDEEILVPETPTAEETTVVEAPTANETLQSSIAESLERPQPVVKPASEPVQLWSDITGLISTDEYNERYAGVCPQQQPQDSIFWHQQRYLAFADHYSHKWPTPIYYADIYWNLYKIEGYTDGELRVSNFANMGWPSNQETRKVGFYFDFATVSVYWDSMFDEERPYVSRNDTSSYDQAVNEVNAYLRDLDARYNSQCGV